MAFSDWSSRLTAIGATSVELTSISASYQQDAANVQAALDLLVATQSNAELLVMLNVWRANPGPFRNGYPGGGLLFGTGVAVLTGQSADDAYPIGAGTGQRITDYAVIKEAPLNVAWAEYGAKIDGATDDSAAWSSALTAVATHGGEIYVPPGTGPSVILSQLVLPNENPGASYPRQKKIRIFGSGGWAAGQAKTVDGGSCLDLRYNGAGAAKIVTLGIGELEIDHLSLVDGTTDSKPYIWTTGTTLRLHSLYVQGNTAKSSTACDQDFAVLGGTSATSDGTTNAPFQGYGTVIREVAMESMRRLVLGQTFANAVTVRDNWIGHACGSNLAAGAAIEFVGVVGNSCTGNLVDGNEIEVIGYVYGVKLSYAIGNHIRSNGCYDPTNALTLAAVRFDVSAQYNMLLAGYSDDSKMAMFTEDASAAGTNTVITAHQAKPSLFSQGIQIGAAASTNNQLIDNGNGRLRCPGRIEQMTGLASGDHAAAATPGSVVSKVKIYDENANLLGYLPVYSTIT